MLKGFDLTWVSTNLNSLKESDLTCCYFHMQSIFYPLERKTVSVFSAFLFLFEDTSKNLSRTCINLHCLILICLETLLSISSLHNHTNVFILVFNRAKAHHANHTQDSCIYLTPFEIHRVYHIHENYPPPNCVPSQDVWFLWFPMLSSTKCVCGDIQATTGSNPQSVESQFHRKFEYQNSFITFPLDFLFMHIAKHRVKIGICYPANIAKVLGSICRTDTTMQPKV